MCAFSGTRHHTSCDGSENTTFMLRMVARFAAFRCTHCVCVCNVCVVCVCVSRVCVSYGIWALSAHTRRDKHTHLPPPPTSSSIIANLEKTRCAASSHTSLEYPYTLPHIHTHTYPCPLLGHTEQKIIHIHIMCTAVKLRAQRIFLGNDVLSFVRTDFVVARPSRRGGRFYGHASENTSSNMNTEHILHQPTPEQ